jgi:hypothetical protein
MWRLLVLSYRNILQIAVTAGLLAVSAVACGKIPRNRYNINPGERIAQLMGMKSDDYCYLKGSDIDLHRQSEKAAAAATPQNPPKIKRRLWTFAGLFSEKEPPASGPSVSTVNPELTSPPSNESTDGATYVDHARFTSANEGIDTARGGGCVFRSLREIWASVLNHGEFKWDGTDLLGVREDTVSRREDQVLAYELKYRGSDSRGEVNYAMYWVHALKEGTVQDPKLIRISFLMSSCGKARWNGVPTGITPMRRWHGMIELQELAPGVTVAIIANMASIMQQSLQDTENAARHLLQKLRNTPPNWNSLQGLQAPR